MIDYKTLELSFREKVYFYTLIVTAVFIIGWLFYDNVLASAPLMVFAKPLGKHYKDKLKQRRDNILLFQFKDILYSMASLISAGRSIGQALEESIEFWRGTYKENDYIIRELKIMADKMKKGNEKDVEVLEDFAFRSGLEDIKDLSSVCKICKKSGGNLPEAIEKSAGIIGDKISLKEEMNTLLAQKRMEGRIIAVSPFVMTFFIRLTAPEYLMPLISTSIGHVISTFTLAITVYSWVLIERMNQIEF